jgi:hypothetical protein
MQKGVILGCGNRSNAGMDTITLPVGQAICTAGAESPPRNDDKNENTPCKA